MQKRALITGVSGQDGYFLSNLLIKMGYTVIGQSRNSRCPAVEMLGVELVQFDPASISSWEQLLKTCPLDEIYHFAGMTFVPNCWRSPSEAVTANVTATVNCLEAIRRYSPSTRFFGASSSEIFGEPMDSACHESLPLHPVSYYGVTKASSLLTVDCFRRQYDLFAVNGIFFNHESEIRRSEFVTRKISIAAAEISLGLREYVTLGNLDVYRDWGYAPEYVDCAFRMLQHDEPTNFVIGSGRLTKLENLVAVAFSAVNLDWRKHVQFDQSLSRSKDHKRIFADASKARTELGWWAATRIEDVMRKMVEADIDRLSKSKRLAA